MADAPRTRRVIVAISGASGAGYGARLLQVLLALDGLALHLLEAEGAALLVLGVGGRGRQPLERGEGQQHEQAAADMAQDLRELAQVLPK